MKVVCAGLMKTGTTSLAKALQILGYKTYDGPEHFSLHLRYWFEIFGERKEPDFLFMYSDVDAITDMPPNAFYEEILKAYPDAKVILSERESEDIWVESWFNQIEKNINLARNPFFVLLRGLSQTLRKSSKVANLSCYHILGTSTIVKGSKFLLKKKYRQHNERVKAAVPSDQLLVYNVTQGWKPLCDFLGCEIPSCPFPWENVKGSLTKKFYPQNIFSLREVGSKIAREVIINISLIVLLISLIIACVFYS